MPARAAAATWEHNWRRQLAAGLFTATTLIAVVVVSRRLGGHLEQGIHPAGAVFVFALLSALNILAAILLKSGAVDVARCASRRGTIDSAVLLATLVPPFALGAALLPAGSPVGLSVIGLLTLLCSSGLLLAGGSIRIPPAMLAQRAASGILVPESAPGVLQAPLECEPTAEFDGEELACSQSMSRIALSDGGEMIEGTFTLQFAAGQQIGVAHLPFSPPLANRPEVSCHLLEDCPVRLRVTAAHTYGARVEAKRMGEVSAAAGVIVGYVVTSARPQSRAA